MWKKIICLIILFNCIIGSLQFSFADDIDEELEDMELSKSIETASVVENEPNINARIAVAYDRKSGKVIYGKNENKRTAMASTTKIMTAIVLIENADLDQTITVSAKAAGTGGSRLGLKHNDKITMKDLLYGLMLKSGNDAAVAIAENVGGSIEKFADLMNEEAKKIGLDNTHYVTPHGLDNPEHYTTAYELAKLADYALKNEIFAKVVNTKNYTVTINGYPKNITNTNELLGYLDGVNGVKTGFTNNAGRCLVTSVNRNEFEIITVVLQADTKKIRTTDSISLIEYVYKNYELINIKEIVDKQFQEWCLINQNRIVINKCKNNNIELYKTQLSNNIIPIKKTDKDNINIEINNLYYFEAPVEKDRIIGTLKVMLNDVVTEVVDIKVKNLIERKDVIDYFKLFLSKLNV